MAARIVLPDVMDVIACNQQTGSVQAESAGAGLVHVAVEQLAVEPLRGLHSLPADSADVHLLHGAALRSIEDQGAVEDVCAKRAGFQRGRRRLDRQPAKRDVHNGFLALPAR